MSLYEPLFSPFSQHSNLKEPNLASQTPNMAPLSLYIRFYTSVTKAFLSIIFARLYTPQGPPCRNLEGQTAIVTGSNSGIGLSIATALAKQGATVYLACRNLDKGRAAMSSIFSQLGPEGDKRVFCCIVDVGDLESVRAFCKMWKAEGRKIDMLCHNAGIAEPPVGSRKMDEKGRDAVLVTNFLGSFLMTCLLEEFLSEKARVVFTSSTGHYSAGGMLMHPRLEVVTPNTVGGEGSVIHKLVAKSKAYLGIGTTSLPAYALSKAHQVLFAALLQRRFDSIPNNQRTAHAFSPGFTSTPIFGKFPVSWKTWFSNPVFALLKVTERYVAVDTDEGAKTGVWLSSCGGEEGLEGGYWEWMERRMSLVELVQGQLDDKEWKSQCERVWNGWEQDSGCNWAAPHNANTSI
jgi:NAD(P)-dependent dehydrogenase (short-subunit alcohol dehydrogenase family)